MIFEYNIFNVYDKNDIEIYRFFMKSRTKFILFCIVFNVVL